jgi:hypothetical protein
MISENTKRLIISLQIDSYSDELVFAELRSNGALTPSGIRIEKAFHFSVDWLR